MAINIQSLKTRTLTSVVFVAVMLTGLLLNHWSFLILFLIVQIGCWLEFQKMITHIDKEYASITLFHKYAVIIAGCGFMLWTTNEMFQIGGVLLNEIGMWLVYCLFLAIPLVEVVVSKQFILKNFAWSLFGFVYISISFSLLVSLRTEGFIFSGSPYTIDFGWVIPLLIIITLWINDTMAYLVGSLIGKTPFSSISPNKTWEGTIGGAMLAVIVISMIGHKALHFEFGIIFIIATVIVIIGTLGDLFESKMKRLAGLKDSGNIMPGHGGFLDRFDSLIMATPFVWLCIKIMS